MIDLSLRHYSSLLDDKCLLADASHGRHVVSNEQNRSTLDSDVAHLLETLLLKLSIANRQYFINEQHLRLQMCCDAKREPDVHTTRITLHRCIKKSFNLSESYNLVKLSIDFGFSHAQYRAVEIDVFAPGELGVESGSHFQQRAYASMNLRMATRRRRDA